MSNNLLTVHYVQGIKLAEVRSIYKDRYIKDLHWIRLREGIVDSKISKRNLSLAEVAILQKAGNLNCALDYFIVESENKS